MMLSYENMFLKNCLQHAEASYWSLVELLMQKEGLPLRQEIEKRLFKPTGNSARVTAPNFTFIIWDSVFVQKAIALEAGSFLLIIIDLIFLRPKSKDLGL